MKRKIKEPTKQEHNPEIDPKFEAMLDKIIEEDYELLKRLADR